ncbi:hypothetical protein SteCoe_1354 [Stentor coeruleus]|uniref:UBA domain-containing protein n=1 Tax=Stentor coeruleus TaxID=5963 RepID=A0A1R2D204_9CILI|nr:hypothetical protein SteCoe_1354 [Stentor coeruleus]
MDTIRVRHKDYRKTVKWTDSLIEFKSLIFNVFGIMNPVIKYYANSDLLASVKTQTDFVNARNAIKKENSFFLIESQASADLNYFENIPLVQSINQNLEDKVSIVIDEISYFKPPSLEMLEEEVIEVVQAGDPNIKNFIKVEDKRQDRNFRENKEIGVKGKYYVEDEEVEEIVDYKENMKHVKGDSLFVKQEEINKLEENKDLHPKCKSIIYYPTNSIHNISNPCIQSSTFTIINKSIGSFNHSISKSQHLSNPQCANCNKFLIKIPYTQCQICINYQLCLPCTQIIHHPHLTKLKNPSYQHEELIEKIKSLGFTDNKEISDALIKSNNNYNNAVKILLTLD